MKNNFLIILLFFFCFVYADEYHIVQSSKNQVKFISQAPLESFEGHTYKVDGYIYWNGTNMTNESQVYIEVDLNSLDTGIGLRNRHMRENYLETFKWPKTWFKGKITEINPASEDSSIVKVDGTIFIHGTERPLFTKAIFIYNNDHILVHSDFYIKLSDFNIKIPKIMFLKLDENIKLELNLIFKKIKE